MKHHNLRGPLMALQHRDSFDVPKWWDRAQNFHDVALYCLVLGFVALGSVRLVLDSADGHPVDEWTRVSPNVVLSIVAVIARLCIDGAFQSGAQAFWWTRLVKDCGITLHDLHHTWEFTYERLPLFYRKRPWNRVRFAAIITLFLGFVGPLLQRSLKVERTTQTLNRVVNLPIRLEPMWNLTVLNTNAEYGWSWSPSMFQPEFASIALDYTQRRPALLSGDKFCDGNCTANITVAGFDRTCTEELLAPKGLPYLRPAQHVLIWDRLRTDQITPRMYHCITLASTNLTEAYATNSSSDPFCNVFRTYYQLEVEHDPNGAPMLSYASYVRPDKQSESLLVQQCNFTTAFVEMTIDITNGSAVALSNRHGPPNDRVLAPIRPPTQIAAASILGGFLQVLRDTYEGYVLWDVNEQSNVILGGGPRLYADTANLTGTVPVDKDHSLTVAFRSPLDDFTNSLNELALRYALTDVPDTNPERVKSNNDYLSTYDDRRNGPITTVTGLLTSAGSMTPIPSKSQPVLITEERSVAVFRKDSKMSNTVTVLVMFSLAAVVLLLMGGWIQGRTFSTSPVEVAKAFDAPVLAGVPSGLPLDRILERMGDVRVRYGEARTEEEIAAAESTARSGCVEVGHKEGIWKWRGAGEAKVVKETSTDTGTGVEKAKGVDLTTTGAATLASAEGSGREMETVIVVEKDGGESVARTVPDSEAGDGPGPAVETAAGKAKGCEESGREGKGKGLDPESLTGSELDLEAGQSARAGSDLEIGKSTGKAVASGSGSRSGSGTMLGSESGSGLRTASLLWSGRQSGASVARARRLVIDRVERVKRPEKGFRYTS